jgi:hypothetical protein
MDCSTHPCCHVEDSQDCCADQTFNHEELCSALCPTKCSIAKLEQSVQIIFSSSQPPFLSCRSFNATSPVWIYCGPHTQASARIRIRARSGLCWKPKTGSSPLRDNTTTSRLATAEARNRDLQLENLRLQSEANNPANESRTVTAEQDMGWRHEIAMSKEDLHATRKHTSSISDLRAEIGKLKAEAGHRSGGEFRYDNGGGPQTQSPGLKPHDNVHTQRRRPIRIS